MSPSSTTDRAAHGCTDPVAGVLAGFIAGAAYLLAQMAFSATVHGGAGWEPLQRISAMLLGHDVLPPPADIDLTIAGIGLLLHFALAVAFGRIVDAMVRGREGAAALVRGAAVGLALYAVNYWLVAPLAFPWFTEARGLTTAIDHLLFGTVCAAVYVPIRRRLRAMPPAVARR